MVAPYRHVGDLAELSARRRARSTPSPCARSTVLGETFRPEGFNIGWNLGRIAGAGVADHVHEHIVPRWQGDTNFMPVLADVRVIPEHLQATHARLVEAWRRVVCEAHDSLGSAHQAGSISRREEGGSLLRREASTRADRVRTW